MATKERLRFWLIGWFCRRCDYLNMPWRLDCKKCGW